MCMYVNISAGVHRFQKRSSDFVELELGRYWELNSGVLQKKYMLMTAEPSLQPSLFVCLFVR